MGEQMLSINLGPKSIGNDFHHCQVSAKESASVDTESGSAIPTPKAVREGVSLYCCKQSNVSAKNILHIPTQFC